MKKLFIIFALAFADKANAQQLVTASGDVQIVTTAGTKTVIEGGGITFKGTSKWKGIGDEIHLIKTSAFNPEGWLDSTTFPGPGAMDISSTGNVFFRGTNRQSFYGPTRFCDLTIRNTIGDTLLSSCEVRNVLKLDTGYVFTKSGYGNDSLLVSDPATSAISSSSNFSKSWVHGRLSRTTNSSGPANEYLFPVGKIKLPDSLYAPIKLDKFNNNINTYTAEYFPSVPFDNLNVNLPIDHISEVEYWLLDAVTPTGNDAYAKVSLSWRTYSLVSSSVAERSNLLIGQYVDNAGFGWYKLGSPGPYVVNSLPDSSFGYVTHPDYLGTFSPLESRYTLASSTSTNPLPVKLIYFTAVADGNKVRLNWEAANEQETQRYEIEKSLNAVNFSYLGAVNSRQQAQSAYVDFDNNPALGWNYYRLKMIEKSGSFAYSPVRPVKFTKGLEQVKVFPNPATDMLNVQLPSSYLNTVTMQLFGADGKIMSTFKPTVNNIKINVSPLAGGSYYILVLKENGEKETYPFIKQ